MLTKWPEPDRGLNEEQVQAVQALYQAVNKATAAGLFIYAFEEGLYVHRSRCDNQTEHWELDESIYPCDPGSMTGYIYRLSPQQEKLADMFELLKSLLGKE